LVLDPFFFPPLPKSWKEQEFRLLDPTQSTEPPPLYWCLYALTKRVGYSFSPPILPGVLSRSSMPVIPGDGPQALRHDLGEHSAPSKALLRAAFNRQFPFGLLPPPPPHTQRLRFTPCPRIAGVWAFSSVNPALLSLQDFGKSVCFFNLSLFPPFVFFFHDVSCRNPVPLLSASTPRHTKRTLHVLNPVTTRQIDAVFLPSFPYQSKCEEAPPPFCRFTSAEMPLSSLLIRHERKTSSSLFPLSPRGRYRLISPACIINASPPSSCLWGGVEDAASFVILPFSSDCGCHPLPPITTAPSLRMLPSTF